MTQSISVLFQLRVEVKDGSMKPLSVVYRLQVNINRNRNPPRWVFPQNNWDIQETDTPQDPVAQLNVADDDQQVIS